MKSGWDLSLSQGQLGYCRLLCMLFLGLPNGTYFKSGERENKRLLCTSFMLEFVSSMLCGVCIDGALCHACTLDCVQNCMYPLFAIVFLLTIGF